MSVFPQGLWGGHFPDVGAQYVHPVSGEGPLRLCHVCSYPAGLSRGKRKHVSGIKRVATMTIYILRYFEKIVLFTFLLRDKSVNNNIPLHSFYNINAVRLICSLKCLPVCAVANIANV